MEKDEKEGGEMKKMGKDGKGRRSEPPSHFFPARGR